MGPSNGWTPGPDAGRTEKGAFVATSALANGVYVNAAGAYSVCGYVPRMEASFGLIYLGLDDSVDYQRQSAAINAAIGAISERDAFELAYEIARALPASAKADAKAVGVAVLAGVSRAWFDLPDGQHMREGAMDLGSLLAPHCPGDFAAPSGNVFIPNPSIWLRWAGQLLGKRLRSAVTDFVRERRNQPSTLSGTLSTVIFSSMSKEPDDLVARTLVGVMMGFLPTVEGNLHNVVGAWRKTDAFTTLQTQYRQSPQATAYDRARAVLHPALMATMQDDPVPPAVWRTATQDHVVGGNTLVEVKKGEQVEVRISEATKTDKDNGITDVMAVFGGAKTQNPAPTHGCPGYHAGMGVLLGAIAGVMD